MTPTIKPIALTALYLLPASFVAAELTGDEGRWLLYGLGALAFLAFLFKNALGSMREWKALREGNSINPTPLPVIIEKSLAEKFVDVPQFKEFTKYYHSAHHEIRNEMNAVKLDGEHRGKEMESLLRELNDKNETRSGTIFAAIQKEGHRLDGRVNDVLKEVSKVVGAFEESRRRRP
jgi:hypothetical protein